MTSDPDMNPIAPKTQTPGEKDTFATVSGFGDLNPVDSGSPTPSPNPSPPDRNDSKK